MFIHHVSPSAGSQYGIYLGVIIFHGFPRAFLPLQVVGGSFNPSEKWWSEFVSWDFRWKFPTVSGKSWKFHGSSHHQPDDYGWNMLKYVEIPPKINMVMTWGLGDGKHDWRLLHKPHEIRSESSDTAVIVSLENQRTAMLCLCHIWNWSLWSRFCFCRE